MKISGFKPGGVNRGDKKGAANRSSKKSGDKVDRLESRPVADEDAVEVSDHMATLELIRGLVDSSPDVRTGEVERIVNQLKSGKYKIDFAKVAEGFIKDAIMNEISRKPKKAKS